MPRYFFHVHDGADYPDLQGTTLEGLTEARREAVRFAAALLGEQPEIFWASGEWRMRVSDEGDLTLFELRVLATDAPAIGKY